jgi:hypothetical protein
LPFWQQHYFNCGKQTFDDFWHAYTLLNNINPFCSLQTLHFSWLSCALHVYKKTPNKKQAICLFFQLGYKFCI